MIHITNHEVISYLAVLTTMTATIGYWSSRILMTRLHISKLLVCQYALICLSMDSFGMLVMSVYFKDTFDFTLGDKFSSVGILFLFPLIYITFQTLKMNKTPKLRNWIIAFGPLTLVSLIFMVAILLVHHSSPVRATGLAAYLPLIYNNSIFFGIVCITTFLFIYFSRYRKQIRNYFSNKEMTSYPAVVGLVRVAAAIVVIMYFLLIMRIQYFMNNTGATWALEIASLLLANYLGYCLQQAKALSIPADVNCTTSILSFHDLQEFEEYYQQVDENTLKQEAAQNISRTLQKWIDDPNRYYLQASITVGMVSTQTKIPTKLLSTYLNKTLDTNFNQWINQLRLKHVKYLLTTTNKNLDEIASLCGFTDRSAMSRYFKTSEGISPTDYRNL